MHTRDAVAVVTGGGTGIGKACGLALALAGLDVMLAGRRPDLLEAARSEIETAAPCRTVVGRVTDVAVPDECEALISDAVDRFGRVDVIVNAAAICEPMHALELDAENWDRTLDINLRGSALCSIAAARQMREQGGGRIVLFASINGAISEPESAHYSASKAAISSLARSLAVDLAADQIAVNAIAPGWVRTPMTEGFFEGAAPDAVSRLNPLGRMADASEIAGVIVYLATDAPTFLTGSTLFVDGGQTAAAVLP